MDNETSFLGGVIKITGDATIEINEGCEIYKKDKSEKLAGPVLLKSNNDADDSSFNTYELEEEK
jgi:hypothetical protein